MACTGPNLAYAAQCGDDAYKQIIELLEIEYDLALDFKSPYNPQIPAAKEALRAAIKELFIAEACDTW